MPLIFSGENLVSEIELKIEQIEFAGHRLEVKEIASMIRCVEDNIAEYLYERYYLDGNEHVAKLKEINKKFNVKIFIMSGDFEQDKMALDFIDKELENWQAASLGSAVMPYFININMSEDDLIPNEAAGLLKPIDKCICLKDNVSVTDTFRHEMTHLNDLNFYDIVDVEKNAYKWRNELINAGITEENADYAYENKLEFIAVASEGDFSKYTEEFKEYLILLGMPEWVFNLPYVKR